MLIVRPATDGDLAFVLDSFVLDYRSVPYVEGLTRSQVRQLMVSLLSAGWTCSILCDDGEPEEIIAYAIHRAAQEIAWCHAKAPYRRHGMTRLLLAHVGTTRTRPIVTTFAPAPKLARVLRSSGWRLRHRPYLGIAG